MLQKQQGSSLILMFAAAVVLVAGAFVYYQQNNATASNVRGTTATTTSCQSTGVQQTCYALTSRGFGQPFVVNSLNSSARFNSVAIELATDGKASMVVELRSYDAKKTPVDGTLLASTAAGTLTQAMNGTHQVVITATTPIALANGSYVLVIGSQPFSTEPLKLIGAGSTSTIAQYYDGTGWKKAATGVSNYMVSCKISITNATAYDVFANDQYTISKANNHRAAVAFQSTKDGYLTSATIATTGMTPLISKSTAPKAKLVVVSSAVVAGINLDKMKSAGDITVAFNDTGITITSKSKSGIKVAKNTIYAVILQASDKDFVLTAPSTGAAVESTGNQPALAYDNKDGFGNGASTWIVSATHYFVITPVISDSGVTSTPTPSPSSSASATPSSSPSSSPTPTPPGFR